MYMYVHCMYCSQQTNTRDRLVGNHDGHILQWNLMSKINILQS